MPAEMRPDPGDIGDAPAADHRVGCLVVTIGPRADMPWIVEAAGHAAEAVLADPVFGEIARVAALTGPDMDGDLDELAGLVGRKLREWALSPANPAARVVFGVLVVHPDRVAADALVRWLSSADALARLPVVLLAGAPEPTTAAQEPAPAREPHTDVVRMLLDAVAAVTRETGNAPGFAVDVASLDAPEERPPAPPEDEPRTAGPAAGSRGGGGERGPRRNAGPARRARRGRVAGEPPDARGLGGRR